MNRPANARLKRIHTGCAGARALACVLVWLCVCQTVAATPEPTKAPERSAATESSAASQPERPQAATERSPIHVRIVQNPDEAASAERRERSTYEREQEDLKAQIRSASAAEKQVELTRWAVGVSILGTIGLFFTIWLTRHSVNEATRAADAANENTAALISAERAYVKLSILDPGVQHRETEGQFFVTVQVKNFGRTPTTVSDARIGAEYREHGDLLPAEPPVRSTEGQARRTGFLVPGEDFMFEKNFGLGSSSLEASRSKRLWVFGYVDYVALGKRYRSGFARLYEPGLRRDIRNLSPDTERGGYDFDRKRERDEGDDW